jgi:ankyrin repeat protein
MTNKPVTDFFDVEQSEIDRFCAMYGCDVKATDKEGATLLHEAAGYWDVAVVRFLVSKGANVNAQDQYGFTPLFAAISDNADIEVFKYLVSKGASVNGKNDTTATLLALAKEMDNPAVVECLSNVGKQ